jgi:ribonucleases P/MRP protein subunit RPP40
LCGFRRGYSTQHTLIFLLNKWHECINNGGIVGTLLMDLSKAYDFIPHDLLIAKLEAYGFSKESLKFLISYISGRKQRVRIGSSVSNWVDILSGVPQGSILGPILFNIFINDIFFFIKDTELCNFADDNTLYACDYSLEKVIFRLQKEATNTIAWFKFNSMVANPDKFQLLLVGLKNTKNQYLKIGNITVFASDRVKLLGVTIDKNLNFGEHIKYLCSKANGKCFALSRIRSFLSRNKATLLFNAFIMSNFSYCPLIWMF